MADPDRIVFAHPDHARQAYELAATLQDIGLGVEVRLNSHVPAGSVYVMDPPESVSPLQWPDPTCSDDHQGAGQ